jgi:hypothetical protein
MFIFQVQSCHWGNSINTLDFCATSYSHGGLNQMWIPTEVCLIRIKEQVDEKRSTVCTHRYADCLLKNTSTKENKYVVNQKLEHGYA